MGVTAQTLDYLMILYSQIKFKSICDLGDQQFMSCYPFTEGSYVKFFYEKRGVDYLSVDVNGKGDSTYLDLNKPEFLDRKFDVVTNIGTLEHVYNFYMGLKHMHELCDDRGFMVHISPVLDNWPKHGYNYVSTQFFRDLARLCKYSLIDNRESPTLIGGEDANQVYCILRKTSESKFLSQEEFSTIKGLEVVAWDEEQFLELSKYTKNITQKNGGYVFNFNDLGVV